MRAAVEAGATRVVVGLGGTATNDGGAGLLTALGGRLLDADGRDLPPGGAALRGLARLELPPPLGVELVAATDVDSPLLGIAGASALYGPQKGASRADVLDLDDGLRRLADLLEPRTRPGARPAGGGRRRRARRRAARPRRGARERARRW